MKFHRKDTADFPKLKKSLVTTSRTFKKFDKNNPSAYPANNKNAAKKVKEKNKKSSGGKGGTCNGWVGEKGEAGAGELRHPTRGRGKCLLGGPD